jgi:uncharacterized YccA/Bax inhibitor family protein
MPNPALNDGIFQRETRASQPPGSFTPGWGSPASELPPGMFQQPGSAGPIPGQGAPPTGGPVEVGGGDVMRLGGTISATFVLLAILLVTGWFGWQAVTVTESVRLIDGTIERTPSIPPWTMIAVLVGFGLAILTVFKPKLARVTGPLYAAAEGVFLGVISHAFDAWYPGIVVQAVMVTIAVFAVMLVLFATRVIRVTEKLRMAVIGATLAIALVYVVGLVVSLFGGNMPLIHDASPLGIGFSLLVVGIAAFNLLLDFDLIEKGVAMRAPKYMEWYAAFGLMVTLVWLYLEVLRLLAKLRER